MEVKKKCDRTAKPMVNMINMKLNSKGKILENHSPSFSYPNLPLVSLLPEGLSVWSFTDTGCLSFRRLTPISSLPK